MNEYHKNDIEPYRLNLALKQAFVDLDLDLQEIFDDFTPLDLDRENRRLESLLDFIEKYKQAGSRETMERIAGGFCFPPIYPGIDPESDWYRFELWLRGESTRLTIAAQLTPDIALKNPDDISEEDIAAELGKLLEAISATGNDVAVKDDVPARLLYRELLEWLGEKHELCGPFGGGWTFDGCSGYCPGCFQRPWCDSGQELCWPEDEKAGMMFLIEEVRQYVSASPQSLAMLQASKAKHDEWDAKWEQEIKSKQAGPFLDHEGLRTYEMEGDDLPF